MNKHHGFIGTIADDVVSWAFEKCNDSRYKGEGHVEYPQRFMFGFMSVKTAGLSD